MVAEGYKNTEIGVIPEDWKTPRLMELTDIISGGTPSTKISEYWGGEIQWMNSGELNLRRVFEVEGRITKIGLENSATKLIPNKCVLVGLAGQGKTRGTVAINYIPLCTNQSIAAILPSNELNEEFLYQNLDLRYKELRSLSTGEGGRGGLNLTLLKNLIIPLPPLSEQNAIATALSDADALISATERLIAKKKAIKQGAIQELLKPKEGWKTIIIDKLGQTFRGLSGKSRNDFENGNCPYIQFMNIMSNAVIDTTYFDYVYIKDGESQNKAIQGDLFFNTSSETPEEVGMCSVLLENIPDLYLNSFCFGFRLNNKMGYNGLYLSYFFRSSYGRKLLFSLAQGATRHNLSKNNFLKTEIQLPKPSEQTRIATILSDMDAEISLLEQKLEKHKQIKQGMMQNLLTGKIRLLGNADKQVKKPKHNEQINEAVIISFLVHKFGTKKYPLSRFRYTKYAYLLHRQSEREARGFNKHAAGPYNPANRYKGAEDIAVKNKYITKVQNPTSQNDAFVVNENIEGALNYFQEWYGTEIQQWIEQFRFYKNEYLEVLTTVDKAICELAQKRNTIDVQNIKAYIDSIPQWKKKLEKPYFSDIEIQRAIDESNKLFGNG
jgi:predicted type I restriction-modification enzyme, S subunit